MVLMILMIQDFNVFKNKSNKIHLEQFLEAQFPVEVKTLECDVIYCIQDEWCSLITG